MFTKEFLYEFLTKGTLIYLALVAFMFFYQRNLMYHPGGEHPPINSLGIDPPVIAAIEPEEDLQIEGWYWPPAQENGDVIVFFHGNAQAYQFWMNKLNIFKQQGYGALFAEYRGYGGNPGKPTQEGLFGDGRAYVAWLKEQGISPEQIIIYGESLGTGIAVQMAAEFPVKAVILESAFSSAADIGQATYPIFPVHLLMKDPYRSIDVIDKLAMPKFFVHAERDTLTPLRYAQKLYDAAPEPKRFKIIEGAGHNNLYDFDTALHISEFLRTLESEKKE